MKEFRSEEAFTPLATRTASRHPSSILRDYNITCRRRRERLHYINAVTSFTAITRATPNKQKTLVLLH